ncbi:MAG: carbon storage regulator [Legionellales bacterium RIFCSPHIGHO2_12_FULL_42_9]|nr:MAG: carbon storage regulator [Legionellales bacterium RIFCSPHIGHO2_12_FULL_42_9]
MEIIVLKYEEPLRIKLNGELVEIIVFKTAEPGNVKFGINAPRTVTVNREEINLAIKRRQLEKCK